MKKKLTGALVLIMFLLAGTTAFAQSSDSDFVDTSEGVPVETFLGFQFNMDFQNCTDYYTVDDITGKMFIPSINLGARGYFMEPGDLGIQIGAVVMLNVGFINQTMDNWKPTGKNYQYMLNMGGLIGGTLRAHLGSSGLAFVADIGLSINMDLVSYDHYIWYYYEWGTREYSETSFGVGLTPALQYHLPLVDKMNLIFEFGVNFDVGFFTMGKQAVKRANGDDYYSYSGSMNKDPYNYGPRIRIGPYLNVGVNF